MSQRYPPDEFDRITTPPGRRGAHRARQRPVAAVLPTLLVLLTVLAVAAGVNALLSNRPPGSAATAGAVSPPATETPTTEPPTTEPPTTEPPATEPPTTGPTTSGPTTSPGTTTSPPEQDVDRNAPVRVVNGTSTEGLARRGAQLLIEAGWDVSGTGNYQGDQVPTTVFYGKPALRATAQAVADDLGGAAVELDPDFTESVTVVLGTDFRGA